MQNNIILKIINKFYGNMDIGQVKRKVITFIGIIFIIFSLLQAFGNTDIKLSITCGFFAALILYFPIRIRECFSLSWRATVVIFGVYACLIGTIPLKTGLDWLIVPLILLPIIDIGLSIFVVITRK